MCRECADSYTGLIAIQYLSGMATVFIRIRTYILYTGCKLQAIWNFWKAGIGMKIFYFPGMRVFTDKWILVRIRLPIRILLRVFNTAHHPWKTIVVALPNP